MVDYPRCRIYRQFVQSLITDRSIRTGGGSGLFYDTVLCSYANFRTSYRRIDGISYTVYPGEWICTVKELAGWFRTHFQHQAMVVYDDFVPYSFSFREERVNGTGICGGIILHGQDDLKKACYGMHT